MRPNRAVPVNKVTVNNEDGDERSGDDPAVAAATKAGTGGSGRDGDDITTAASPAEGRAGPTELAAAAATAAAAAGARAEAAAGGDEIVGPAPVLVVFFPDCKSATRRRFWNAQRECVKREADAAETPNKTKIQMGYNQFSTS